MPYRAKFLTLRNAQTRLALLSLNLGYQIQNSSKEGDIILDTFGGSGTTIVACEQIGRKARVMELDPHYCNVIIARWEKLTGQKAVKVG